MLIPFPNISTPKECFECIDYISSYLPKLEYTQWVSTSTPDPKISSLNITDVLGWAFDPTSLQGYQWPFGQISYRTIINIKYKRLISCQRSDPNLTLGQSNKRFKMMNIVLKFVYFPIKNFLIWHYQLTRHQDQNLYSPDIKESVFLKSNSDTWWYHKLLCLK